MPEAQYIIEKNVCLVVQKFECGGQYVFDH